MKQALIRIIRQEHLQLEALINSELQRIDPDRARLDNLRREARDLRRQLDFYAGH